MNLLLYGRWKVCEFYYRASYHIIIFVVNFNLDIGCRDLICFQHSTHTVDVLQSSIKVIAAPTSPLELIIYVFPDARFALFFTILCALQPALNCSRIFTDSWFCRIFISYYYNREIDMALKTLHQPEIRVLFRIAFR